ncbi:uncharacterized protein GGS22DRAFT_187989 [Annulohypoxylon maeteangense]|uniref:uncharacterized protein n=1 Tax=Annulohypoxylon maeteangense TaxID=1927788 RepID=UPI002008AA6A|nr:uncharacterized protein GGS22DRAFT_187989 [Annulohypoxylon maeteangense]KAI0885706.1 hypothetical protein GGS22DRAFT_187989 [Annulohypoxylon maeteangense]
MKSIILSAVTLLASVALVDADTTTATSTSSTSSTTTTTSATVATTTTGCAAQNIVDTCLDTTESYVSLCGTTDYQCLCDKCFNNCPNDPRGPSYTQQRDSYCQTASLYATTSGNLTMSRTITPTSVPAATTSTNVIIKSMDASGTAAATESGNDAQERITRVGGMLAGVAGIVAVFL